MAEPGEGAAKIEVLRPQVLWRAFTVDPRTLTPEVFHKPLTPGRRSEEDSTKMPDGNEYGVYMSTNRSMVEAAYAHTDIEGLHLEAPAYSDRGLITREVALPQCGMVCEIDTTGLPIRPPKITNYLRGVYNNGFAGQEWIADEVPSQNYNVRSLILSRWANDNQRFKVNLRVSGPEEMKEAIEAIQGEFAVKEAEAREFVAFLESLDPAGRLHDFYIDRKWKEYLRQKQASLSQ